MQRKKILIIDDEADFTEMVKNNLEKKGKYEVRTLNQAAEAVDAAEEFKPDLIFLDIVMPGIDGGELAGQMKGNENIKDIPIVFLTAIIVKDEVSSRHGNIGGHPFLAKPVSTQELIDCIEKNIKTN